MHDQWWKELTYSVSIQQFETSISTTSNSPLLKTYISSKEEGVLYYCIQLWCAIVL